MIKRQGEPGHEISETNMQLCVNCCAFALDTTMPEMQEDRVALYIKMHIEMILGPTWHVIVGRNFGFCITAEARHLKCETSHAKYARHSLQNCTRRSSQQGHEVTG